MIAYDRPQALSVLFLSLRCSQPERLSLMPMLRQYDIVRTSKSNSLCPRYNRAGYISPCRIFPSSHTDNQTPYSPIPDVRYSYRCHAPFCPEMYSLMPENILPVPINEMSNLSNVSKLSSSKKPLSILRIIGTVALYSFRISSTVSVTIFTTVRP